MPNHIFCLFHSSIPVPDLHPVIYLRMPSFLLPVASSLLSALRRSPRQEVFVLQHSTSQDKVYYRNPNHLNVIKREIAKYVRFKDAMSYGEDADYSKRIRPYLSVQGEIEKPLYFYDCVSNK